MAHAVSGKAGAVTWGGGAINGKLTNWEANFSAEVIVDRGAGEDWQSRIPNFADWEVTFEAYSLDQADWSLSSAAAETALINATTTISLKRKSTDLNPWFTATGITTRIERMHPIEGQPSSYRVTVQCSEGTAPTIDTTPAT